MFRILSYLIMYLVLFSCSDEPTANVTGEWLIPKNQVFDGGPGKDGIPALTNPQFITIAEADFIADNDLVVLFKNATDIRIYAHRILDWHEIINDDVSGNKITVSYCPLTGSTIGLSRVFTKADSSLKETTFGVSGLLFNSNLILYDRYTDSYWSQMLNQCIAGELRGTKPNNITLLETTFKTARTMFPEAKVVSNATGVYSKSQYQSYPYGDYRSNNSYLIFPIQNDDSRLPRKERILGVKMNGENKAYRFADFTDQFILSDFVGGESIIVIGNSQKNYMIAFKSQLTNGKSVSFVEFESTTGDKIFKDTFGNIYNIFGEVIDGSDIGEHLKPTYSYISFWFAWAAFNPETEIY